MGIQEGRHKEVGRLSMEEMVLLGSFNLLRHFSLEEINSGACLPVFGNNTLEVVCIYIVLII